MRIGVIGSGGQGTALARRFAELGHEVAIANARGPQSLTAHAAEIGATPASVAEAVAGADVVIVSIPTIAVPELPPGLLADLDDRVVVIDTTNYHPELRDGRIAAIDGGLLDSEWVAQQLGRPVIKAFNNIFAHSLLENGRPAGDPERIALPVAGDRAEARAIMLELIDDLGFDPVDGGGLDDSWRQQPGTPAYCQDLGAAALRAALAAAQRSRIDEYRVGEEERIKRSIAAQGG
jgi:predicted dinucleotide-binding enzyme